MANDIFSRMQQSPLALAGLAIMGGSQVGDALKQGAMQSQEYANQKKAEENNQKMIALQQQLPALLNTLDPNDPQGSVNTLISAGLPIDAALQIVGDINKMQRQKQQQDMLSGLFSGGGSSGNPDAIAAYGAMTGNPALVQYGLGVKKSGEEVPKFKAKEDIKANIKSEETKMVQAQGASDFLNKVGSLEEAITSLGDGGGAIQASGKARTLGSLLGTQSEAQRQAIDSLLADLELSVATMDLKGQGVITDAEREIARKKLPKLTNNIRANIAIINNLKKQANRKLKDSQDLMPSIDQTAAEQAASGVPSFPDEKIQDGGNIQSPIAEGTVAENPTTGEVIIFRNGSWVSQ